MRTRWIVMFCLAAGCGRAGGSGGDDGAEGSAQDGELPAGESLAQSTYHSLAVTDATALPDCVVEAEGWLVYLKAEKQFQVCSSGAWSVIDIDATDNAPPAGAEKPKPTVGVFDRDGQLVGFPVEGKETAVLLSKSGLVVSLTSLADGFDPAGDLHSCLYLMDSCSGSCLMRDGTKAIFVSSNKLLIPKGTVTVSGAYAFYFRKEGACQAVDEQIDATTLRSTQEFSVTLPLRVRELGP